jgi:hypothetical protein
MIKLGNVVKDKLSDFKGTVIARAEYLYGCVWVCVIPSKLHEGKPIEDAWFDEDRLQIISEKQKYKQRIKSEEKLVYHGGPMLSMPKPHHPKPSR